MNIILLDHIEKVGAKHDVVKVKDGYGRNYLIPQGLALVANRTNLARLEGLKQVASKKEGALIARYQEVANRIAGLNLRIEAKAGESGRLFGSVTAQHISNALLAQGIEAEKRIIEMPDEVKELGSYTATVKFHPAVQATVNFEVVNEGDAAPATPAAAIAAPAAKMPQAEAEVLAAMPPAAAEPMEEPAALQAEAEPDTTDEADMSAEADTATELPNPEDRAEGETEMEVVQEMSEETAATTEAENA